MYSICDCVFLYSNNLIEFLYNVIDEVVFINDTEGSLVRFNGLSEHKQKRIYSFAIEYWNEI
jgi:hypothetical protein